MLPVEDASNAAAEEGPRFGWCPDIVWCSIDGTSIPVCPMLLFNVERWGRVCVINTQLRVIRHSAKDYFGLLHEKWRQKLSWWYGPFNPFIIIRPRGSRHRVCEFARTEEAWSRRLRLILWVITARALLLHWYGMPLLHMNVLCGSLCFYGVRLCCS